MKALASKVLQEVYACLPASREALMLFGSAARGDMTEHSDIDVLVLQKGAPRSKRIGRVNISFYPIQALTKMACDGSLFIRHLILDGMVIEDPRGELEAILIQYRKPADYTKFRAELRALLPMFDISETAFSKTGNGFLSAAIFCLRSDVYIRADEANILNFSLNALAASTGWDEVNVLLSARRPNNAQSWDIFKEVVLSLERSLQAKCANPYGSIEAYITNLHDSHSLVLSMGLRILSGSNATINYDILSPFSWVSGR